MNILGIGVPLTADFDGDGKTDLGVWDPQAFSNGLGLLQYVPSTSLKLQSFTGGQPGDIPLVGHFDPSKFCGFGVWRPSNFTFYIWPGAAKAFTLVLGQAGDIPLLGDFDGDHVADMTVFRPSTGTFTFVYSSTQKQASFPVPGAQAGDIPLVAVFDNKSGKTGVAVWRPSNATFYVYPAAAAAFTTKLGQSGDIPLTADFDGDGISDLAVWNPNTGVLSFIESSNGSLQNFPAGVPGDVPMPSEPATLTGSSGSYTISGKVLSGSTPVQAVLMSLVDLAGNWWNTYSQPDGSYSFSAAAGGSYTVYTPLPGYTPPLVSVSNLIANQTVNFQAPPSGAQKTNLYFGNQPMAVSPF